MDVLRLLCGTLWRNVDVLWRNVDVMWSNVDVLWMLYGTLWRNVVVLWSNVDVLWMLCGTLWRNEVDVLWRNVDVMWNLHISTFHNLTKSSPPPWSVILKYAIVDVMWIHRISTLTIKMTADPFCRLYSSVHLLSVSWSCIWSLYCTRALALLYSVSLEALKSYAFAKSLGLVSQDLNSKSKA